MFWFGSVVLLLTFWLSFPLKGSDLGPMPQGGYAAYPFMWSWLFLNAYPCTFIHLLLQERHIHILLDKEKKKWLGTKFQMPVTLSQEHYVTTTLTLLCWKWVIPILMQVWVHVSGVQYTMETLTSILLLYLCFSGSKKILFHSFFSCSVKYCPTHT